jgi:hypothetical protein
MVTPTRYSPDRSAPAWRFEVVQIDVRDVLKPAHEPSAGTVRLARDVETVGICLAVENCDALLGEAGVRQPLLHTPDRLVVREDAHHKVRRIRERVASGALGRHS